MIGLDIYGKLKEYCFSLEKPILFTTYQHYNFFISNQIFENGKLILIADFIINPINKGTQISKCTFTGFLKLGLKFDNNGIKPYNGTDGTYCNLDETYMQKYFTRLKDLNQIMFNLITDFACINELELQNISIQNEIDQSDEDIDFVNCKLTLIDN